MHYECPRHHCFRVSSRQAIYIAKQLYGPDSDCKPPAGLAVTCGRESNFNAKNIGLVSSECVFLFQVLVHLKARLEVKYMDILCIIIVIFGKCNLIV